MNRTITALASLGLVAVVATGCKSGASPDAVSPSASAAAHQELVIAEGTAQGCLQKGSMFTHSGRKAIKTCAENAVPRKNARHAEVCAIKAILVTVPAQGQTRHTAVENALAQCLVRYGTVAK